jgi:hypothetical protein
MAIMKEVVNLNCEYLPTHFKMFGTCNQLGIKVKVYAKNFDDTLIFDNLREMYENQGMDDYKAAIRARAVIKDFFTICNLMSNKHVLPFKAVIQVLDFSQNNHGKQVHLQ